jgi:putative membrane protein insertion efficiency factor
MTDGRGRGWRGALRQAVVLPIRVYRMVISPLLPGACIYTPTCSQYALDAIVRHGVLRGLAAGIARVLRCAGGLFEGGEDPVPERVTWRAITDGYRRFWRRKRRR